MTAPTTKTRGRPKKIDINALNAADTASMALGKQKQAGEGVGGIGKQGADASGKAPKADTVGELRGGAKQVLITEAKIGSRGGRPAGAEDYPFVMLTPAKKMADGSIVGPSFFIPETDRAQGKLQVARKRYREADGSPALFWSRSVVEQVNGEGPAVPGLRIWRGTPSLLDQV